MSAATDAPAGAGRARLDPGRLGNVAVLVLLVVLAVALAWSQVEPWLWALPPAGRTLAAGALLFCHAALIAAFRRRAGASTMTAGLAGFVEPARAEWLVVHASQTGQAEALAGQAAGALQAGGRKVAVLPLSLLDVDTLSRTRRLLLVASTTGEGDPPDNAATFVRACLGNASIRLEHLEYGLLALGDRAYGEFCAFGRLLDDWLRQAGARPLFGMIEVDDHDAEALRQWRDQLGTLGVRLEAGSPGVPPQAWRLATRTLLNPGSPGAPVHDLVLEPAPGTAPEWRAGDIAVVQPPGSDAVREYSIASVPEEGQLRLLVREQRRADGSPGLGSGWLTRRLEPGATIQVAIRANPRFHVPPDARPLILIGNGTGVAGLRALLRARMEAGHHRNWLMLGERTAAHDFHYGDELREWQAAGCLPRLDVVFSRDGDRLRYVQHLLARHGQEVRTWVDEGASIHVCGSLLGMAPGVDAALESLLGRQALDHMAATGRYCRDVY